MSLRCEIPNVLKLTQKYCLDFYKIFLFGQLNCIEAVQYIVIKNNCQDPLNIGTMYVYNVTGRITLCFTFLF